MFIDAIALCLILVAMEPMVFLFAEGSTVILAIISDELCGERSV